MDLVTSSYKFSSFGEREQKAAEDGMPVVNRRATLNRSLEPRTMPTITNWNNTLRFWVNLQDFKRKLNLGFTFYQKRSMFYLLHIHYHIRICFQFNAATPSVISLSVLSRRCVPKTGFPPRFLFDIRIPIARVRVYANFAALILRWFRVRFVCPYTWGSSPLFPLLIVWHLVNTELINLCLHRQGIVVINFKLIAFWGAVQFITRLCVNWIPGLFITESLHLPSLQRNNCLS